MISRLIAVVLAIGFGALAWMIWDQSQEVVSMQPTPADVLTSLGVPGAVTECVDKRISEIDGWVENGIMDAETAALSKGRAQTYCMQTN